MNFFTELKKEINSPSHDLVKDLVKLRKDKGFRYENKQLLVMGNKVVKELSQRVEMDLLILSGKEDSSITGKKTLVITPKIMKKITGLDSPEEMAAVISFPELAFPEKPKRILVLDQISDPGNIGTLIRTAAGLDWDGIFITDTSVDPFNTKALRAAKGATFVIPIKQCNSQAIEEYTKKEKIHDIYLADMGGTSMYDKNSYKKPLMLILSNEAHGTSSWASKVSSCKISIPISSKVESLNVAISGAILMAQIKA